MTSSTTSLRMCGVSAAGETSGYDGVWDTDASPTPHACARSVDFRARGECARRIFASDILAPNPLLAVSVDWPS